MSNYEITCPHCNTAFKLDEAGYADIVSQVRTVEFEAELHKQLEAAEKAKKTEIKLAEAEATKKAEAETAKITGEFEKLKAELKNAEVAKELEITKATSEIQKEADKLKGELEQAKLKQDLEAKNIKETYEAQLKLRDTQIMDREEQIERLRDMKAKLSTKMVGETLELHCQNSFNMIRAAAFPSATFIKDTDGKTGSQGDYIFKDVSAEGTPYISIMFEMKNENDTTAKKKKNEDFLKELDKDRIEKKCEYAVLVSLLEADSDLYNTGIVDVSHLYPKMYVVRPQFFIPLITLLRNAAMKTIETKNQLAIYERQNLDLAAFKSKVSTVQESLANTYRLASERYSDAIEDIDKAIKALQATRENLLKSEGHLKNGVKKGEDLSIENLTKGNETMKKKFDELPEEDTE
jgi:hypothetical protein